MHVAQADTRGGPAEGPEEPVRSARCSPLRYASHGFAFRSFTEEHLSTENELVRNILLATLSLLAKLEREKISQRTKAGLERARAKGKVLGRPRFSDGDRDNLIAALRTGDSWHAVSKATGIPYSTVKKHARALGYTPKAGDTGFNLAAKIPHG
jgi:DNA invertase Pin-like site-specific DNA recombinase